MKKIVLALEYGTNNIFIYDENGEELDEDLPEESQNDRELASLMDDIRRKYKAACEDDTGQFEYWIDTLREDKLGGMDSFISELKRFAELVKERLGDRYEIVDKFTEFYGEEK